MNATARRLGLPVISHETRNDRQHAVRGLVLPTRMRASERVPVEYPDDAPPRPETRADCYRTPRPCPFVSCRYHLYLDLNPSGSLRVNFPELEPGELRPSCSLDVAAFGKLSLEHVAYVMNLTRERVRQLERDALRKLRAIKAWIP